MDQNKIASAIYELWPSGIDDSLVNNTKPSPFNYDSFVDWLNGDAPTLAAMQEAAARFEAKKAAKLEKVRIREGIAKYWESLPEFITGPHDHKFKEVSRFLDAGSEEKAIAVVQYADPSASYSTVELDKFQEVREFLINALKSL